MPNSQNVIVKYKFCLKNLSKKEDYPKRDDLLTFHSVHP